MNAILNLFTKVLELGCGVTLEQALKSDRYATLIASQQTLLDRYAADTDLGIALRAGHFVMGRLLNTLPEPQALAEAQEVQSIYGHGIEMRSLLQLTGEHLIDTAAGCLPANAIMMGNEWRLANAERQIEIAETLYLELQDTGQRARAGHNLATSDVQDSLRRHIEANSGGSERVLPLQYGTWNKESCRANCQGKSQMITAFARLAGANVLLVHPIRQAKGVLAEWKEKLLECLVADMEERDLTIDRGFADSIHAHALLDAIHRPGDSFHCCSALELADGRWVLIDPHALNWGVFPNVWQMPQLAERLLKYEEVLPGLQLYAADDETHHRIFAKIMAEAEHLIERSRSLEKMFQEAGSTLPSFTERFLESDELSFIIRHFTDNDESLEEPIMRRLYGTCLLYGLTEWTDALSIGILFRGMEDQEFIKQRIGSLLTVYHNIASEQVNDRWNDTGKLLHTHCAFSLPEYHLAVAALNSVAIDLGMNPGQFFVDYAFDEITLYNAMSNGIWCRDEQLLDLARAAADATRSLPYIHSQSRIRLRMLGEE